MKNFIIQYYSSLILFVEILAVVTGLVLYKKYKQTTAKYFIIFLCYVLFQVFVGKYSLYVKDGGIFSFLDGTRLERNYWWFTLSWRIVAVYFFSWYFQKILKNNLNIKVLKYSTFLFLLISFYTIFTNFDLFFNGPFSIISIGGGIIILQCAFFYFYEILQSENILNFYKSLNFYISCAILVFWLIKTPLVFYEVYFNKDDINYVHLRGYINLFVIMFMYLTFTVGLIVSKPEND